MKNVWSILLLVGLLVPSCRNTNDSTNSSSNAQLDEVYTFSDLDTSDMQNISLVEYDLNMSIKLPVVATATGAEIKPIIQHIDGDYLWFISIGEQFKLVIEDYAKEFNKVQWFQKRLDAQKDVFAVTYLVKEPHLLFYKRELVAGNGGKPTYHCFSELEIDGYNYVLRSSEFGGHEQVIKDMVVSIKTARPITIANS
ncbi:MAG: hypothetical protein R3279_02585 [Putridiphycobacter sp.]|nr:hypothetical protein [Putridiphycobacter sp.]